MLSGGIAWRGVRDGAAQRAPRWGVESGDACRGGKQLGRIGRCGGTPSPGSLRDPTSPASGRGEGGGGRRGCCPVGSLGGGCVMGRLSARRGGAWSLATRAEAASNLGGSVGAGAHPHPERFALRPLPRKPGEGKRGGGVALVGEHSLWCA